MPEKLRIAVYHNLHSGGAKRTLCAITKRLGQHHHLDMYDLSCSDRDFCDVSSSVARTYTYTFKPLPEFHKPFGSLNPAARLIDLFRLQRLQRRIADDIDRRGYDVVYVHPCQFSQTPALLCFLQTPSLYHSREPLRAAYEPDVERPYSARRGMQRLRDRVNITTAIYRRKRKRIDRAGVGRASLIVTNSYFTREALYRIYAVNARVCYHGIDTEAYRPLDLPRNKGVLSVGALTPAKGFDFIIKSLALIPTATRPALTVVSNYQERAEQLYLEKLAECSGVSVQFLCMVSDETLVESYNQAQLVVYAPILEPFGLVPLESMACGTPVVAVAEGGVRESVLHEYTGLLVERDPAKFAEAVQYLLANPTLARHYGRNSREHVLRNWTWDRAVDKLESHLTTCARMR